MARKHPQVIAHHATSAANNPQPPPRRYRGRRQLTRGAARRAGQPLGGGDQQTGAGRPAQPQGPDSLSAGRGAASLSGRAGRTGDRPVSGCAPAAASSDHARPVAWTLIRAPPQDEGGTYRASQVRAPSLVKSRLEGNLPPGHATCPTPMRSAAPRDGAPAQDEGALRLALHRDGLPEKMREAHGEARSTPCAALRGAALRSATQDKGVNHSAVQSSPLPEKNRGSGSGSHHDGVVHGVTRGSRPPV